MCLPKIWLNLEPHPAVYEVLKGKAEIIGPLARPGTENPLSEIEEAEAVLASTDFPAIRSTFEKAVNLKVVARYGIGLDSVDVNAATDLGICVVHTPDAPTISAAEFAIGLMLSVSRKMLLLDKTIRNGGWQSKALMGHELNGKVVGLVGSGRIGSRVAKILQAFESHVIIYDPYVAPETVKELGAEVAGSMEELLKTSDIVSLHLPFSAATKGLIGRKEFSLMKPNAILVNIARGPIVVEKDLYEALLEGEIAGAGIDVWENEPTTKNNPLFTLDNLIATPHAAALTWEGKGRSNPSAAEQALQVLRGERPPFLANPDVWDKRREL